MQHATSVCRALRRVPWQRLAALALAAGLAGPAAGVAAAEPRVSVSPLVGHQSGGRLQRVDDTAERSVPGETSLALAVNLAQRRAHHYELFYAQQRPRLRGTPPLELRIEYLHVGGQAGWFDGRQHRYAVGGLGATRLSPRTEADRSRDIRPSLSLGFGVQWPFDRGLALRLEARGYLTWISGEREFACLSAPPEQAACAIRYTGDTLLQFSVLAGLRIGS